MHPRLLILSITGFIVLAALLGFTLLQSLAAVPRASAFPRATELRVVDKISFGASRAGVLVANPITSKIFAAQEDVPALAAIDAQTNQILDEIPLRGYHTGATLDLVQNEIYIAQEFSQTLRVIDGATHKILRELPVAGGSPIGEIAFDSNSNRVYVIRNDIQSVAILDHRDGALLGTLPIDAHYGDLAHNPQTERLYISSPLYDKLTVVNTANNTIVAEIPVGKNPKTIALNPATNRIYVSVTNENVVAVIDGATNQVLTRISVGELPIGIEVNPLRNRVYVGNFGSKDLSVIDGASNRVLATLPLQIQAVHIAILPELERVYIGSDDGKGVTYVQDSAALTNHQALSSDASVRTFLVENDALPANWNQIEFDERGWENAAQTNCDGYELLKPHTQAQWIWFPQCKQSAQTALFRKTFELPSENFQGVLRLRADDMARVFLNGQPLGMTRVWTTEDWYDLTPHLRAGKNVLALQVDNKLGFGTLMFRADLFTR